jgi:DNA-binding NarL/FixJ family response regulator
MFSAVPLNAGVTQLAPREWEVLGLMAQGCSNAGIAARLYLSGKTVEWYVNRIFAALSIPAGAEYNRRVCAVLAYLASSAGNAATALKVEPDDVP